MAPGNRIEPHDGHAWPEPEIEDADGTGGRLADDLPDMVAGAVPSIVAAPPGTMNGFWQTGQRTVFPAALSGTCIDR